LYFEIDRVEILLENAGKKFYREWIFRRMNLSFQSGEQIAVLGPNGSGKSTLLQVISGAILPTEGTIVYRNATGLIPAESIYREVAISAPYLELIDEFTFGEIVRLHFHFKKVLPGFTMEEIIVQSGLSQSRDKVYKYFSSGMKQRVKLALAFFSDVNMLLLDEPCANLDQDGINWYQDLVRQFSLNRLMVICSNTVEEEYNFCSRKLLMTDFKL